MEKKTKHRILGILVVVGLVIVSLPLFQGSGHESGATLVNAPAFPDQSVQVEATTPPVDTKSPASAAVQTSPIPIHDPSADTGINQLPDDTIAPNATLPASPAQAPSMGQPDSGIAVPNPDSGSGADDNSSDDDSEPSTNDGATDNSESVPSKNAQHISDLAPVVPQALTQDVSAQTADKIVSPTTEMIVTAPKVKKAALTTKKPLIAKSIMRSAAIKPASNDINGLIKLKQSVWVIQLGSFKSKTNALRLVNQLRLKGYHAFIQQVDARTRVFVGPEGKQQIARMVASQLEEEMHISGMVVSYKPLAL